MQTTEPAGQVVPLDRSRRRGPYGSLRITSGDLACFVDRHFERLVAGVIYVIASFVRLVNEHTKRQSAVVYVFDGASDGSLAHLFDFAACFTAYSVARPSPSSSSGSATSRFWIA